MPGRPLPPPSLTSGRGKAEPLVTHSFAISIDGITSGFFQECAGLSGSNEVFEIKEGGLNAYAHKFINRTSYGDITLKRGFWSNTSLFKWFERTALNTATERHNGTIEMLSGGFQAAQNKMGIWHFRNAFPLKWDGPGLNAGSSTLAVESLTLAVEYIYFEKP